MGAGISSTLSMGLTYCFCQSASSLCNACFGSTDAGTTGRKRSVLLLTLAVASALLFQYYVAPSILHHTGWWNVYKSIPGVGKRMYEAWMDGCDRYGGENSAGYAQCVGNNGVYRPTFVSALFFAISAIGAKFRPALNREAWPAKYCIYFFLLLASVFVPNHPLFDGFFLISSRIGAMFFIVLQQIILIDVAYNWNESWVDRANECDREEWGSGRAWLRAIVATCVAMYAAALAGIGFLFHYYKGCPENNAVVSLTLIGIVVITVVQLTGTEGSLLTSSVISAYAVYLAFSIVSKNPNGACNPNLGSNDAWGIAAGLFLTAVSLAWTGFSWTAEERLSADGAQATKTVAQNVPAAARPGGDRLDLDVPFLEPEDAPTSGLVVETDGEPAERAAAAPIPAGGKDLWKLNVVLVFISCWIAMMLTGWGTIRAVAEPEGDGERTAANPTVGRYNMAMIGVSQWTCLMLYGWTLVAPRLFPDRDFS
uniref:Serine incorporator n=1 Tax=Trieres chinensis TaxID=1514140 RepID=A0A7S2E8Y5_TRICV|mmetsp:Transcript_13080/g.27047  ORF Transcript_13080/g.27047 Transcript_13080/m.27047 type:complete len:482 (+) Transcript_13080:133-1578(+)